MSWAYASTMFVVVHILLNVFHVYSMISFDVCNMDMAQAVYTYPSTFFSPTFFGAQMRFLCFIDQQ